MKIKINDFPKEKRLNIRVSSLLFLVAFLMISLVTYAGPKKVKFTGEWTLNKADSYIAEYGEMMASAKLKITQKRKNLVIERVGTSQTGENYTYTEMYTLDGKECENTIYETTIKKSTAAWSEDKKSITITSTVLFEYEGNKMEIGLIETLEFTEDGNSLSVSQFASSSYGDIENTLIFNKE